MAAAIEFKRGDDVTHYFKIPTSGWSAGGKLFFTAKPAIDDDISDAAAVINKTFTDTDMVNDGTTVTYTLSFPGSLTSGIASGGKTFKDYLGEFQFVSITNKVTSFPANNKYIPVKIYFDVRRGVT